jgi:hypothetical protein
MAAPFVLVLNDARIAGYYTLSSTSVQITELPRRPHASSRDTRSYRRRSWADLPSIAAIRARGTGATC